MLRSRKQRDLRARLGPAGLLLTFLVRIQTVDPSPFEMPDAPANEAGVFYFRGRFAVESKVYLLTNRDPRRQTLVLVKYGEQREQTRNSLGLTILLSEYSHSQGIAKREAFQIFLSGIAFRRNLSS
jgi:hypothetical protein